MQFTQRYNKTLQRPVYYVKSNTVSSATQLLLALRYQYNVHTDYAFKMCKSKTHKHCLKLINTATGNMLPTDYTF